MEVIEAYNVILGGMKIIYPSAPEEIIAEGQALHHCVGSYVNRVANKECIILFLRQSAEETKPFYTMEVRQMKVVQVRGMKNEGPTLEVQRFVDQWVETCTPGAGYRTTGSIISRLRRLLIGGNTVY